MTNLISKILILRSLRLILIYQYKWHMIYLHALSITFASLWNRIWEHQSFSFLKRESKSRMSRESSCVYREIHQYFLFGRFIFWMLRPIINWTGWMKVALDALDFGHFHSKLFLGQSQRSGSWIQLTNVAIIQLMNGPSAQNDTSYVSNKNQNFQSALDFFSFHSAVKALHKEIA